MSLIDKDTYEFGDFRLDVAERILQRTSGEEIPLPNKVFETLCILVRNSGSLVTKEQLLTEVWDGAFVEENNLDKNISVLRRALGESRDGQAFIENVRKSGYRFLPPVKLVAIEEKPATKDFEDLSLGDERNAGLKTAPGNDLPFSRNGNVIAVTEWQNEPTDSIDKSSDKSRLRSSLPNASNETLIGRERDLTAIKNLLRQREVRLVTLTGAGGSGKTRLAEAVAEQMSAEFSDGVFLIELAAVRDAELVIPAIAQALEIKESGRKPLLEILQNHLREKRLLIVLDNFEQILVAARFLPQLLASTTAVKIMVTSRAALHLNIEHEFSVLPLASPPPDFAGSAAELIKYPAVALFVERARLATANFVLTEGNAAVVAEICAKLDGLPLAIELAAARVRLLPLTGILKRLENRLQILTGGTRDLPARQQTMRNAVEWSYDLLEANEKVLFRQLAVFAGGFTIEAAEAVINNQRLTLSNAREKSEQSIDNKKLLESDVNRLTPGDRWLTVVNQIPADTIVDLLSSLVDRNLLVRKEQKNEETRLRMLEIVREFGLELLEASDETSLMRRSHADFFLILAERAEPELRSAQSAEWFEILEREFDNLRTAFEWFIENEPTAALRLAGAICFFWHTHGNLTEGRKWLGTVLEKSGDAPPDARGKVVTGAGNLARLQGNFASSRKFYEQALQLGKETHNKKQIAVACRGLGAVSLDQNNLGAALRFLEEGLKISRELRDQRLTSLTLNSLGELSRIKCDYAAARRFYEESLTLSERLGNKESAATSLFNLGTVAYQEGDAAIAHLNYTQSLTICQELGDKSGISVCLDGFAALAVMRGNWQEAAQLAGAAERLRDEIGYKIETPDRIFRDDYTSKIHAALGNQPFLAALNKGRALIINEILELAEWQRETVFTDEESTATEPLTVAPIIVKDAPQESVSAPYITENDGLIKSDAVKSNNVVLDGKKGETVAGRTGRNFWIWATTLAVCGLLTGALFFWNNSGGNSFNKVELKALTTSGNVIEAAVAPDGKMFAYVKNERGQQSLWIRQTSLPASEIRLTEPSAEGFVGLSFKPDASRIYYLLRPKNNSIARLLAVPTLGGQPSKEILTDIDSPPAFAPDGKQFAFMRRNTKTGVTALLIADENGLNVQTLIERRAPYDFMLRPLAWSPNGKTIACVANVEDGTTSAKRQFVEVNVENKMMTALSEQTWWQIETIAWTRTGDALIFTASESKNLLRYSLWHLSVPNGAAQKLTNDLNNYRNVSVARNAQEILVRETQSENHVWLIDAKSSGGAAALPRRISPNKADGAQGVAWTPDGNLIFSSTINGTNNLQKISPVDGANVSLTTDEQVFRYPCATPDGRYLVYTSTEGNSPKLWRIDASGANQHQLTTGNGEFLSCSPDSRFVYYNALKNGQSSIYRISIEGGSPERLTDKITVRPKVSPDGSQIASYYRADAKTSWQMAILAADDGSLRQTLELPQTTQLNAPFSWSADGTALIFVDASQGVSNLWKYPLDGKSPPSALTNFADESLPLILDFAVSPRGDQIAVTRGRLINDVVQLVFR